MSETRTSPSLSLHDEAVQVAYQAATASEWASEDRTSLWHTAIQAVLAYAAQSPGSPRARNLYMLVCDMAPREAASWNEAERRALRLAATHLLDSPTKPHHRPKAQALLRRLDVLEDPFLQARDQVLADIARLLRTLDDAQKLNQRQPVLQTQAQRNHLRQLHAILSEAASNPASAADGNALAMLEELRGLLAGGRCFQPAHEPEYFLLLQRLQAGGRAMPALGAAVDALTALLAQRVPDCMASVFELKSVLYDLRLAELSPEQNEALRRHLGDLAHLASQLHEIPFDTLPALLFRLRQRLADPGNPQIEAAAEGVLAVLDELDAQRAAYWYEIEDLETANDEERRRELARLNQAVRRTDWLLDALYATRLAGLDARQAIALRRLLEEVRALAQAQHLEPEDFSRQATHLARQLEDPTLISEAFWQEGQLAAQQFRAEQRALEERLRSLAVDRKLDATAREASAERLQRQTRALATAAALVEALPYRRLSAGSQHEARQILARVKLAASKILAGAEEDELRQALTRLAQICAPAM